MKQEGIYYVVYDYESPERKKIRKVVGPYSHKAAESHARDIGGFMGIENARILSPLELLAMQAE